MELPLSLSSIATIVFDTNVLISATVYRKFAGDVYDFCAERFTLYTSDWILAEVAEKLSSRKFRVPLSLQQDILAQIRADAQVISPENPLPTASSDPDDNNVLRLALFVKANFLITGDKKHLLVLERIGETEIISPSMFFDRFMK